MAIHYGYRGDGTDLDMSLNLNAQLLQVLYNRAVNRTPKVCMFVCNCTRFVANMIVHILRSPATSVSTASKRLRQSAHLKTSFTQELISRPEGNLDDGTQFRHLSRNVVLNIRKPLEVRHI